MVRQRFSGNVAKPTADLLCWLDFGGSNVRYILNETENKNRKKERMKQKVIDISKFHGPFGEKQILCNPDLTFPNKGFYLS